MTPDLLRRASTVAALAAKALPGPAGMVSGIISAGLALAADFATVGEEPLGAIERIRSTDPRLSAIDVNWRARLMKRFGEHE